MSIKIIAAEDDKIAVISPYNADFVATARTLAGKWGLITTAGETVRAWIFPAEVREQVRAALREVYGQDDQPTETARVRVRYSGELDEGQNGEVVVGGRVIARAFGRDSGARIGENIVLISGRFASGGSRKNWRITISEGTTFDILRLPVAMAHRLEERFPTLCQIIPADGVVPDQVSDPA